MDKNTIFDLRIYLKALLVFALILLMSFLYANESLDSLYIIAEEDSGLARITARLQIGYEHRRRDYDLAIYNINEAYEEAISLGLVDMQAKALFYLGMTNHYFDRSDTALVLLQRSGELYRKEKDKESLGKVLTMEGTVSLRLTGDQVFAIEKYKEALNYSIEASDHMNLAIIYSQLSTIFRLDGSFAQAIEFIHKSKEQYELADYPEGAAWISYSTGNIYTAMNLYENARDAFSESLERYKALPETVSSLTGVAISHDELAMTHLKLGDIENARCNNLQARNIYDEYNLEFGMSNACKYKAMIEFADGNVELALEFLARSRQIKKAINDVLGLPSVYRLYGEIFYSMGNLQAAKDSLELGLKYAVPNNQKIVTINLSSMLSDIYFETGNYENAYFYLKNQIDLSDSISLSSATRAVTQLEDLYKLEAKEKKIRQLEQDKIVNQISLERQVAVRNLLVIILSMTIVFAFYILRVHISNKEINETLKRNQKSLQELNATKDKFSSIIAHDLKSPFNTLMGFSSLLKTALAKNNYQKASEYAGHIESISTQTYKLLENLLEWSRSQTGQISFKPKALDIRTPIRETVRLMETIAKQKHLEIDLNIQPVVILADENMIHTILQNLISNAIKYSYHGSKIKIFTREKNNMLELEIKDRGVGMDEEKRSQLFLIDKAVSEHGTDGEPGTGLGLIISKEFIELHRGKIEVESELGKGTCFRMYLPL
ncbi:MAG: ATP-binding protein [Candidatus Neomarinimicrobiota bacterium]|jgi:signal transduction histidine kinase